MIPALAAATWSLVLLDCKDRPELAVTYVLPFVVVMMAMLPWCPPDDFGRAQACLFSTEGGFWDAGTATSFEPPNPPLNQAYVYRVVALDAARMNSDEECP